MAGKNTLRLLPLPIFFDRFDSLPRNQIGTQLCNRILHRPLWSVNTARHHSVCPDSHRALVKYLTSSIYLHTKWLAEKNGYLNQIFLRRNATCVLSPNKWRFLLRNVDTQLIMTECFNRASTGFKNWIHAKSVRE